MRDDFSYQMLPPKSDQLDLKLEDVIDTEDENTDSASRVIEAELLTVMTQREMEILTTLFPKASQTLAGVLRKRSHLP
jgi:hypothetical protein